MADYFERHIPKKKTETLIYCKEHKGWGMMQSSEFNKICKDCYKKDREEARKKFYRPGKKAK